MASLPVETLLFPLRVHAEKGAKLVEDLHEEQMIAQPGTPADGLAVNHPAWILAHLNCYLPVAAGLLDGQTPEDPKHHRYGMNSQPKPEAAEYPDKAELLAAWNAGHARVADLLSAADEHAASRPMPVERWREKFPTVGHVLGYLLIHHEGYHLGQLSAWRRVSGLPAAG
ncbi:DinB family protein [Phycisphaera mikurensis]|uniref:DinB-like domain-containing protein n=1 Tax=Phycisphaera mikurensis (strain NBRC 102666 / KCTC 22515 / FYK2301M01) TaxID=1142394 RepID=I0IBS3_PHYMF|nr:DinB family protein [Phycisphaera mikurensis]MBB6442057.1 hypothetical protein [Phycisphaera mikurensis]BAM02711.1 hypothetical protein PSMK_05520 [Phycisphaera mikurensis NBRC 102666]